MSEMNACGIVRDLMPLVVDGAANEESRRLVESHAAACAECGRMLADMRAAAPGEAAAPAAEDTRFILFCRSLERHFRWQRLALWLALALVVIGALAGFGAYARFKMYVDGAPMYAGEDAVEFYIDDSGQLVMYARPVSPRHPIVQYQMLVNGDIAYVCAMQSAWPQLFGTEVSSDPMVYDELRLRDGELTLCEFTYEWRVDEYGMTDLKRMVKPVTPLSALRYGTYEDSFAVWEKGEPVEIPPLPTEGS